MALSGVLPLLRRRREFLFVSEQLASGRNPWVTGPAGAAKACLIAALAAHNVPEHPQWLVLTPGREQAEERLEERRLARPVVADERDDFSRAHAEGDPVKDLLLAVTADEVRRLQNGGHRPK